MRMRVVLSGLALIFLYTVFLGRHGVLQQTEARYAEVAREMAVSHDFLMPTLNGVPHVQKPPVSYWLAAGSMMVFGDNEIGARAAPLAAGIGVLLLTAWIGTIWFDRKVGLIAALLLAVSIEFYALSRTLCADMIMAFWSMAAIAAFSYATCRIQKPTARHFMLFFVFMGIAFATKGPMGMLVPLCMAVGWQLHSQRYGASGQRIPWLRGLAVMFGLAAAWFIAVAWRYPELWTYFLKYELMDRFFSSVHGRSEPIWYFVPVLLGGWMPWTPLLIPLLSRRFGTICGDNSDHSTWALACWVGIPFIILSLSGSKLATYILPLFPGIALWFASRLRAADRARSLTVAVGFQMTFFLVIGLAGSVILFPGTVLLPELSVDVWFLPLWLFAVLAVLGAYWQLRKGITLSRLVPASLASLLLYGTLSSQIMNLAPAMGSGVSLRPLAKRIMSEPGWEEAQVVVAGTRGHGMEFYLKRVVDSIWTHSDVALPLSADLVSRIHPSNQEITFKTNDVSCYLVTRDRNLRRGEFPLDQWTVLQRQGVFVLLRRGVQSDHFCAEF